MIEEESKNKYILLKILLVFFVIYVVLYISTKTGYYEYKTYTKTKLTEEAMVKFEKDISEGKNVTIDDYLIEEHIDYSNNLSKLGSNIGNTIDNIMNKSIKKTLNILSELFYE